MARRRQNKPLRIFVPLALVLAAIGIAVAVATNTGRHGPSPQGAPQEAPQTAQQPAPETRDRPARDPDPADPETPAREATDPAGEAVQREPEREPDAPSLSPAPSDLLEGLRPRRVGAPMLADDAFRPLGSLDPDTGLRMRVDFSRYGSGVAELALTNYFDSVVNGVPIIVQREVDDERTGQGVTPFSLDFVFVNGVAVPLQAIPEEVQTDEGPLTGERRIWEQDPSNPGLFTATIENAEGEAILRIVRRFSLQPGSYTLRVEQTVENLTDTGLRVSLSELGPVEPPRVSAYAGDQRRLRFGYVEEQRSLTQVWPDTNLMRRDSAIGPTRADRFEASRVLWPTRDALRDQWGLSWYAVVNRYFAVAVRPWFDPDVRQSDLRFREGQEVTRGVLFLGPERRDAVIVLRTLTPERPVLAGSSIDLGYAVYAGPLDRRTIGAEPGAEQLRLSGLVVYNFGGMCASCTFQWLTEPLMAVLRAAHSVTGDWALAIIVLVLIVRTILHPVTKWSQIRVQRFGKQMQELAPKQKKLQERYGNDRKKMQQEMARLWREEGVSPAGMLGCLPMFLQSPIWIALYASLFFAFELRHEPAFFGVFQAATGGNWRFLADLAEPDRAIYFGSGFMVPFVGNLIGEIKSINVLPVLLAFVFWAHQKYLTPPTSATMTPEQETQMKIMRFMLIFMFPLIMYNAPSGLALYFIANSSLGILENRWIKRHMDKHGLLDIEKMKEERKRKGPSFIQRIQMMAAERQQMQQGGGKRDPRTMAAKRQGKGKAASKPPPARFKKRK